MERKVTLRDKIILVFWIIFAKAFFLSRLDLVWSRLWIRKDKDNLVRRRNIANQKKIEGPEGARVREELLVLLNQQDTIYACTVVDTFVLQKDMKSSARFIVPYPSAGSDALHLDVFLGELNISFIYSSKFFVKKWRNEYDI